MSYLTDLIKEIGGEYTTLASEIDERQEFCDTGCYILNAVLSGSIYGGVPDNKITALAGLESSGKTFFSLSIVKHFLDNNPTGACLYFDTESAITKQMLLDREIDVNRLIVINVVTIEEFRNKALKAVNHYLGLKKNARTPMMYVLDSLGMLSTNKEINDALEGKETKDMTKAGLIKGAFRMLTLKLGQAEIPMLVTNHLYANIGGYGEPTTQSGGSGLKYAASTIVNLSKSKDKEGNDVVGNFIKIKISKSRFSVENKQVEAHLYYDERGLDKYYGLLELGELGGLWKKVSTRYEINGKKVYAKQVLKNPEEYFTPEVLDKLDKIAKTEFKYGQSKRSDTDISEDTDEGDLQPAD